MSGVKWLYISEAMQLHEIPNPKNWEFKPITELADKEVLQVCLYYETYNRKPYRLITINFDRVRLDKNGGYIISNDILNLKMRNFLEYGFTTAEGLSERKEPWSVPDAPVIPSNVEIEVLKNYLKVKFPLLHRSCAEIITKVILDKKNIHQKNIDLIKKAANIRNKNSKKKNRT